MSLKPIILWVTPPGPNPWKVLNIIEELSIPYEIKAIRFEETKFKPFIDVNPNGRVPAIQDPNTGLTLWESGAIIQYLIEQYDKEHRLSYGSESLKERQLCNQWLMFQVSGQGPYFGQIGWFSMLHREKLPSAIERYNNESKRVLSVLDNELAKGKWLVGDKMTFADLAFIFWNHFLDQVRGTPGENPINDFPNVKAWHEKMIARPSFKKVMLIRQRYMEEQGIVPATGLPQGQTFEEALAGIDEERKRQEGRYN